MTRRPAAYLIFKDYNLVLKDPADYEFGILDTDISNDAGPEL
jgi:hypothetical protein